TLPAGRTAGALRARRVSVNRLASWPRSARRRPPCKLAVQCSIAASCWSLEALRLQPPPPLSQRRRVTLSVPRLQPRALLLDCDGTVVDSMPTHHRAWRGAFEAH